MLRVLHVIWSLAGGGAERVVLALARGAPADIRCTVQPIAPGGALEGDFADAGIFVLPAVRSGARMTGAAVARLAAVARRHDVVHTHLWAGDTWGRLAGFLAGRPVISTEHNTRPDAGWRGRISAAMSPFSHQIVCVSDAAAESARRAGVRAARLTVIPNGVDLAHHVPTSLPEGVPPRLLFCGRLVEQKGADVLLDAVERLDDIPDLEVRLLGEGHQRLALAEHPVVREGRAELIGWRPDLRPHLSWCSVVVMPSRWEGFGLFALEALASGRPVVASGVDALPEIVGNAGWMVPPGDPPALAGMLRTVLGDPQEVAARAARAPGRARRFTVDAMVSAYADIWRRLPAGRRGIYNGGRV
ncbi:MAG: glycosyltransferase family 4 protein [Myxococcota bacterium]|nr:glycosyltransferase family 4 protein [Myxococcota bacterium]MEC8423445.1 glycosyltransferase family 4 protein [Myxococcota bacterium]